jgi:hypothetical protein
MSSWQLARHFKTEQPTEIMARLRPFVENIFLEKFLEKNKFLEKFSRNSSNNNRNSNQVFYTFGILTTKMTTKV